MVAELNRPLLDVEEEFLDEEFLETSEPDEDLVSDEVLETLEQQLDADEFDDEEDESDDEQTDLSLDGFGDDSALLAAMDAAVAAEAQEQASNEEEEADPTNQDESDDKQLDLNLDQFDQEEEVELVVDPRSARTRISFAQHPLAKAALVGSVSLALLSIIGLITSGTLTGRPDPVATTSDTEQIGEASNTGLETAEIPPDQDFAECLTEFERLKQTNQNVSIRQAQQTGQPGESTEPFLDSDYPTDLATCKAQISMMGGFDPAAAYVLNTPQQQPTPTPTASPTITPASQSVVRTVPAPPMPTVASAVRPAAAPTPQLNPVEQWQQAAQMGSFGTGNFSSTGYAGASPSYSTIPTTPPATPAYTPEPSYSYSPPPSSRGSSISQLRSSSTTPGLRDQAMASVLVGTTTSAEMATSVLLTSDNTLSSDPSDPNAVKYLIRLTSPLTDSNGAIALPEGALLVGVVSNFSNQSGALQMQAISVLVDNREYQLPPGAILIRGEEGGQITADRDGGSNGVLDILLPSLFSGLSEAGEALSNPRSTVTTNNGITTSTSDNEPNIGASFTSGTFRSLSDQITQQAQEARSLASQGATIWEVEAGESVQVFVNNSFEM